MLILKAVSVLTRKAIRTNNDLCFGLLGSIYQNIETENYKCLIFVRSTDNNHYLTTLQNSGVWETSCGADTYSKIHHFTGFDIHNWIDQNIDWMNDFAPQMKDAVTRNELQNYLNW